MRQFFPFMIVYYIPDQRWQEKIPLEMNCFVGLYQYGTYLQKYAERLFGSKYDIQSKIEIQATITYSIEKWKKKTGNLIPGIL